jgi:hypothetical protein
MLDPASVAGVFVIVTEMVPESPGMNAAGETCTAVTATEGFASAPAGAAEKAKSTSIATMLKDIKENPLNSIDISPYFI